MAGPRRAAPLAPDERRRAIVAATIPLLQQYGVDVTTRQIAEAAGVAEGTLFRVFPDKDSIVQAAVRSAFEVDPTVRELEAIDPGLPLDEKLHAIAEALQRRLRAVIDVMRSVRLLRPPDPPPGAPCDPPPHQAFLDRIVVLLEPDRDQLRVSPAEVARLLRLLTFAGTHDDITDGNPLTAGEIAAVLLDGVRRQGPPTEPHPR